MQVKYGNYAHEVFENWWRIESRIRYTAVGFPQSVIHRITLWGEKKADNPAAITTALQALENAYSADGQDLIIYLADGVTQSQHAILNAGSLDGTQVKSFQYLDRDPRYGQSGVEYQFKRSYQITIQSERPAASVPNIISWEETVMQVGTGGPVNIFKGALQGPPQKQTIQLETSFKAFQSGRAVGWMGPPTPATPLWPSDEHFERRRFTERTPKFGVMVNTVYPIEWRYEFERNSAFLGSPSPLP